MLYEKTRWRKEYRHQREKAQDRTFRERGECKFDVVPSQNREKLEKEEKEEEKNNNKKNKL